MRVGYKSRIPKIAAELGPTLDAVAKAGAERVEQGAKSRVPVATGKLRNAIHTEREGVGEYAVIAGDGDVFYGHIVEHGGAHTAARPFLIPAAEEARAEYVAAAKAALRRIA